MIIQHKLSVRLIQFIKFGLVGVSNTLVSLAIYYVLLNFSVHYLHATLAGYLVSSISGYLINKFWVFDGKKVKFGPSLVRYYIVYASSFGINMSMMYVQVSIFEISKSIAPLFVLCVTIPFNFVLSKYWVYRVHNRRIENENHA